jgi:mRNA interferase RelE/StbE
VKYSGNSDFDLCLGANRTRRLATPDRDTAMRILHALTRYGEVGDGDVKRLTDREGLYRLRVGKWRVFFDLDNRGQAY